MILPHFLLWVMKWLHPTAFYPHMLIGKMWMYRFLFVILFVCTVTDFSTKDKASSVKFYTVVHRRPWHGISHFAELCFSRSSPRSLKLDAIYVGAWTRVAHALADLSSALATHMTGMCGWRSVPTDVLVAVCIVSHWWWIDRRSVQKWHSEVLSGCLHIQIQQLAHQQPIQPRGVWMKPRYMKI